MFRRKNSVDVTKAHGMATNDGYVIVDVRTDKERTESHPPGSIHIELETIPDNLAQLQGKKVLAFCRSGNRSSHAAKYLEAQGIEAHNVSGGIIAWQKAELPLVAGSA
ncbi:MAG: rhodanese-like domain-containing protein [Acidimicrobiia bacterium]